MNLPGIYNFGGIASQLNVEDVMECNHISQKYGLQLTAQQAREVVLARNRSIQNYGRIELGIAVIKKIIAAFCISSYITREDYASTINELIDIFYYMKNETEDRIGDDELIDIMQEYFNTSCRGSLELLKNREMALFARKFRRELQETDYSIKQGDKYEIYKY